MKKLHRKPLAWLMTLLCLIVVGDSLAQIEFPDAFVFHNAADEVIGWFDSNGNFYTVGQIIVDSDELTPTSAGEWIVKNPNGTVVARLNSETGDLHLNGCVAVECGSADPFGPCPDPLTPAGGWGDFIIQNNAGEPVSWITGNGDLILTGTTPARFIPVEIRVWDVATGGIGAPCLASRDGEEIDAWWDDPSQAPGTRLNGADSPWNLGVSENNCPLAESTPDTSLFALKTIARGDHYLDVVLQNEGCCAGSGFDNWLTARVLPTSCYDFQAQTHGFEPPVPSWHTFYFPF